MFGVLKQIDPNLTKLKVFENDKEVDGVATGYLQTF